MAVVAFAFSGCMSDAVARGALIGAASGVALGAGTGVLISDEHLLGSSKASQLQLAPKSAIGASVVIGGVFGAIIGAMIGHNYDRPAKELPAGSSADNQKPTSLF